MIQSLKLIDFTVFSFQAIKHITTGDGGMLCIKDKKLIEKAKRIRWFGIDRRKKQEDPLNKNIQKNQSAKPNPRTGLS